ncbi:MAG: hypothetical protein ACE5H3_05875 [Planctomycetota bacterium]
MPSSSVLERFEREKQRGLLADAYLLVGPSRLGREELARAFAARLLGLPGGPGFHPDFVVFDPRALGTPSLKVEHIARRKEGVPNLEEALRYRPERGGARAVLLFEADAMNPDAQAALLKTAEEPPPGTVLILTAGTLGPLLPALRSRCRTYRVPALPAAVLAGRAAEEGIDPGAWEALSRGLGGEAVLELPPEERSRLLEIGEAFQAWRRGEAGPAGWLAPPEGASLAEQRERGARGLSACLGWLARAYPAAGAPQALALDRLVRLLTGALAELGGQITPGLVFERLLGGVEEIRKSG